MVRRSLGFGLWLIFLLVILTGLAAAHSENLSLLSSRMHVGPHDETLAELFGNLHEMDQSFDQNLVPGSSVYIDSPRGGVNVSGTSTDGRMHIQLRREIYTNSDGDAQQKAEKLVPQIRAVGSRLDLSLPAVEGTETSMTVTIPPATQLSINTTHGAISVNGINADLVLASNHGDINVDNSTGSVHGRIVNSDSSFNVHHVVGSVYLDGFGHDITATDVTGSVFVTGGGGGSAHFERVGGSASYHSDRTRFDVTRLDGQFDTNGKYLTVERAFGPLTLTTYSYDITLDRISGNATVYNKNGSIDFIGAPPLGSINLKSGNGAINLTVPQRSSFTIDADAYRGQFFSEFPSLQQQPQQHNNHTLLNGTIGSGGSLIHIVTTNGDVSLHKADIQPLPATPPAPGPATAFNTHPPTPGEARAQAREEVRRVIADTKENIRQTAAGIRQAQREAQNAGR
jgi:DUF4097 and DUF4098 domain-containing protein YvlB